MAEIFSKETRWTGWIQGRNYALLCEYTPRASQDAAGCPNALRGRRRLLEQPGRHEASPRNSLAHSHVRVTRWLVVSTLEAAMSISRGTEHSVGWSSLLQMGVGTSHRLTAKLTAKSCAVFALLLGAVTLAGWVFGFPLIVQVRPNLTPMVVNSAVGFMLGGCALFAATRNDRWSRRIAMLLGALTALLAVEELCVLVFDISPALSLPELHRPLQPDYAHPGRMAPNTALCFLLFGAGLLAVMRSNRKNVAGWARKAALAVLAIGLLGVIGYSLQLEYLYAWSGVVRMAMHTGIGMVVLGIGLWNLVAARTDTPVDLDGDEVAGVYRAASLLLLLVASSAGIGGFAFLQGQVEQQVRDDLLHMTADRITLFEQIIQERTGRAKVLSDNVRLAALLRTLARAPSDPAMADALRALAGRQKGDGFSSVVAIVAGRSWQLAGIPARPMLAVALRGDIAGSLLWQNGYVLRLGLPLHDDAGSVGMLITEQPLDALSAVSRATNRLGETGEMTVCAPDAARMHCFPLRSRPQPFSTARVVGGHPLPMDYALRGQSGAVIALDYRQHRVLAAYGPIGNIGFGLVVKRDIAEIYAPIRQQFQLIVIFLGALLMVGLWVMRLRLRPLLCKLEDSRAQAKADSTHLEAAMESNLDAFFILECMRDAVGAIQDFRYAMLNERGEQVLEQPRELVIGRGMCDLFPALRSSGMLDEFTQVVETGKPMVEERRSVIQQSRWYHMQAVKLDDGVALTVRDITSERHAADRIRHQALHDPLTGLANRAGFESAFAEAIAETQRHGKTTALALLDLDGLKRINDSLGHAVGDHLLKEVASRLRDCLRPSDTVARLGGDEFVLVLPNGISPAGIDVVARNVLASIAQPMQLDGHAITVTASIGFSSCPRDGYDHAHLLKCADAAMYQAKRAGRNGYVVYDAMFEQGDPNR